MIDFSKIAAAALCQAEGICCELFPGGRRDGVEFRIGSLAGDEGKSLAINLRTGRWKDFSSGDSGKDLIALWAAAHNVSMADAAKELDAKLNAGGFTQSAEAGHFAKGYKLSKWTPLPFAPETPPPSELRLFRDNKWQPFPVARSWAYRDAESRLVGYVCRINYADGKKDTIPYSFCRQEDGTEKWVQKGFAKPKPIYNLGALLANPTAGVFIVEGEKCADALQTILKGAVAIAWPGGAQAIARHAADIDWSPLKGRKIVCLPDADSLTDRQTKRLLPAIQQPGIKAMLDAEAILSGIAESVFVALPPDDWKDGYDIADAIEDGWTLERLVTHIKRRRAEAKELGVTVRAHLEALALAAQEPPLEAVQVPEVSTPTPEAKTPASGQPAVETTAILTGITSQGSDTDLDAAIRLVEWQGPVCKTAPEGQDTIRYAKGLGWMIWDGRRWRVDEENLGMQELTKESVRRWVNLMLSCAADDPGAKAAVKAARSYEARSHIESIIKLARSDPRIFLEGELIDANPLVINCPNGLLDLTSGTLKPHDRSFFCTRITVAEYHPDATHPAVDTVLRTIAETCGADMSDFLARAFGMCLTGDVSADSLFLLQGEGGAGKTTLLEAMARLMGDYAVKLPFESFVLNKSGRAPGGASPDLMRLRGARLAIAEEGDRTATLDAGRIKELTGGGEITARNLYSSYAQFKATHHLWLCSNFEPRADADDSGVWRRMVKVRFKSIPPEKRDPSIRTDLLNDPQARDALFAWAVRGCMEWLQNLGGRDGLIIPKSVQDLTNEYRKRLDSVGQWFEEGIETGALTQGSCFTSTNKDLREAYEKWCDDNGALPLGKNRFSDALTARGLIGTKTMHGKTWGGVSIKTLNYHAF